MKVYEQANLAYLETQNALLAIKENMARRQGELLKEHKPKNEPERDSLFRCEFPKLYEAKVVKEAELNTRSAARRNAELAWDLLRYEMRLEVNAVREGRLVPPCVSDEQAQTVLV